MAFHLAVDEDLGNGVDKSGFLQVMNRVFGIEFFRRSYADIEHEFPVFEFVPVFIVGKSGSQDFINPVFEMTRQAIPP